MLRHVALALLASGLVIACQGPHPPPPAPAAVEGRWSETALDDLAAAATDAVSQGLPSEAPALNEIAMLRERARTDARTRVVLDQLADDMFSRLAQTYARGLVDPTLDPDWRIPRAPAPDMESLLAARVAGEPASVLLSSLLPRDAQYAGLVSAFSQVSVEPARTVDANGLSRERRLESLRVSLERWRWLPRELGERRIEVRIPHFEAVYRGPGAAAVHRVIVGARRTPTPSFAAAIEAVTINPTWTVPSSILSNDLLPRFRRDPSAAAREDFDVLDAQGRIVEPAIVDWAARPFPYSLRQRAGASNALGRLKFEMPNSYDVYLHDTPSRGLFQRQVRALSHGCVRVENAAELAAAILAPSWTQEALQRAIDEGVTSRVPLPARLPIYVLYMTAAADTDGTVRYADDLYRRDAAILAALNAPDTQLAAPTSFAAAVPCRG